MAYPTPDATSGVSEPLARDGARSAAVARIAKPQTVRDIRAELRDTTGRTVYSWTITRPVPVLAPGASAEFDSAAVDIPRGAKNLHLSFIGPTGS